MTDGLIVITGHEEVRPAPREIGELRIVCAWGFPGCLRVLQEGGPGAGISHGVCVNCLQAVRRNLVVRGNEIRRLIDLNEHELAVELHSGAHLVVDHLAARMIAGYFEVYARTVAALRTERHCERCGRPMGILTAAAWEAGGRACGDCPAGDGA